MYLNTLIFLGWALLAGSAAGCVYLLYAGLATRRFAARARPRSSRVATGERAEAALRRRSRSLCRILRSFCRQDYPKWQFVFGVHDLGRSRDRRRAAVDGRVSRRRSCAGGRRAAARRQSQGRQSAEYAAGGAARPLIIADSDMRVRPDYLAAVTAPLARSARPDSSPASIAASPAAACGPTGGAARQSRLPAAGPGGGSGLGGRGGCFGATIALRRDTLDAIGGFAAIADDAGRRSCAGRGGSRASAARVVLSPLYRRQRHRRAEPRRAVPARAALGAHHPLVAPLGLPGLDRDPSGGARGCWRWRSALSRGAAPAMLLVALACRGAHGPDDRSRAAPAADAAVAGAGPRPVVLCSSLSLVSSRARVAWRDQHLPRWPRGPTHPRRR